jgi:hypothetical protein
MSRMAQELGHSKEVQQWCLFHDAAEAYLPDVPRPLKPFFRFYVAPNHVPFGYMEDKILNVVAMTFGLTIPMTLEAAGIVKDLDNRMLATEKRDIMAKEPEPWFPIRIIPWPWYHAKRHFHQMYRELF